MTGPSCQKKYPLGIPCSSLRGYPCLLLPAQVKGFGAVLPSSAHCLSAPRRCWSTFISRTTGLRAVEDFVVGVLLTLVGLTLTSSVSWALLPIPHLCLDYTILLAACQELFLNQAHFYPAAPSGQGLGGRSYRLSWVSPFLSGCLPLAFCVYIIAQMLGNVKYFFSGFSVPKQSRRLGVLLGHVLAREHLAEFVELVEIAAGEGCAVAHLADPCVPVTIPNGIGGLGLDIARTLDQRHMLGPAIHL